MSDMPEAKKGRKRLLFIFAIAGVLAALLLAGAAIVAGAAWMRRHARATATPVPRYRTLVTIESDAHGKIIYRVGEKILASDAELTAELKRLTPQLEFRRGAGIEVGFMIISTMTPDGDSVGQKHLDKARAACEAAGAKVLIPKKPLAVAPVTVKLEVNKEGRTRYRVGSRTVVNSEEALRKAVAELAKTRKPMSVWLRTEPLSGVTKEELMAAKAACLAAGVTVDSVDDSAMLPREMVAAVRSGKRRAGLKIKAVGVRDGALQFRVDGKLVEGREALTSAVRRRIAEIEKDKGGFTCITPTISYASELVVTSQQSNAVDKAVFAAGNQLQGSFGYRGGGGRISNVLKPAKIFIIAAHGKENRYQYGSLALNGEKSLIDAFRRELAEWRKGKTSPQIHFLDVTIRVEVKAGVTATEEQIKLAHRTVNSAGVQRPPRESK